MSTNNQTIFWLSGEKGYKKIATLNSSRKNEYRIWKPYRSCLLYTSDAADE